jgi:isopentenyl-diphosphate delta-isomerase
MSTQHPGQHGARKADHLDLCATDQVAFQRKGTLLDQVELIHDALPELHVDDVDLRTELAGKTLRAPLVIAAMTGGIARAAEVNRALAEVAEELGVAFGFGSMRPLLQDGIALGYEVRDIAPNALLFGNIGVVQAREASTAAIVDMVGRTGCDALCIHLNPAMEVIQPEGDKDFRGGLDTIARLSAELPVPVIVKETGCGLSRAVGQRVAGLGVKWVDVSGAGGTSWVGVETLRARAATRTLGERFWDWGIPTAASVAQLSGLELGVIATGGLSNGLEVARALALGATAGGIARAFLTAYAEGGQTGARAAVQQVIDEIRLATLLTGCARSADLRHAPVVLGDTLRRWVPRGSPLYARAQGV